MLPASQERSHEKLTRIVRTNVRQRSQRTADPSAQAVRGAVGLHPENLLRQARRQKRLPDIAVPDICILDPDGDIVRNLCAAERARRHGGWACYHTELYVFRRDGHEYGIVGCAVGAAFAVLIAEELFASGAAFSSASHPPAKSLRCKLRLIVSLSTERCVMKVRAITICRHPNTARGMSI
jgi:hypothetical protein